MKALRLTFTALGLAALLTAQASAQGGRGGFGGGGGAALLTNKGVLKELKVDDAQTEKLAKASEELQAKGREARQGLQDLSQEERRDKMTALTKTMNADMDKVVGEVLKPEQVNRFKEIRLQVRGADAFGDEAIAKDLKVTDEQKGKIKDLLADQQTQMREIFMGAADDREGAMKKVTELRKETKTKIVALMTEDQKKAWAGLTGAAFEFVPEPPPQRNN